MRSRSSAEANARYCSSGSGSSPRRFSARHAKRIVSRSYCSPSVNGRRPFQPGSAPARTTDRSRYSNAACGRLSTMYGHIASISGPTARPFSCQSQECLAFACLGMTGPVTQPPTSNRQWKVSTSSVVLIEIVATHVGWPLMTLLLIMYEPSPSSSPARYAASVSFMDQVYKDLATKPSYWRTAVKNLRDAESQRDAPALFAVATA